MMDSTLTAAAISMTISTWKSVSWAETPAKIAPVTLPLSSRVGT